jgi:translation initiation factor IF-3
VVVGENIEAKWCMSIGDALRLADEMELDLVEISPNADPQSAKSLIIRYSCINKRRSRKR